MSACRIIVRSADGNTATREYQSHDSSCDEWGIEIIIVLHKISAGYN